MADEKERAPAQVPGFSGYQFRRAVEKVAGGGWTAFVPVWTQGNVTIGLDATSWGYYRCSGGTMQIDVYCKSAGPTGQVANAMQLSGWPTDLGIAGAAVARVVVGTWRFVDVNEGGSRVAYKGGACAYYANLACEMPFTTGKLGGNVGELLLGQTGSGWAGGVEAGDELEVQGWWRV